MLPYIDTPFQHASKFFGASPDELKLVSSFLFSFPLAYLLKCLPSQRPALKNIFSICISLFYLVGLFDMWDGVRTLTLSSVFVYYVAKYLNGPFMPWIVFIFVMGHLSINQLTRQFVNDPSIVDITGAQMILAIKLTSFAWNIADGQLPEKDLSEAQKEKVLKEVPDPLDFAGFIMFFPSLFAGPAFDFVDYKRWIEMKMFEVPSKRTPSNSVRKIPPSFIPAMLKAVGGVFWIILFLKLSTIYYPSFFVGDEYTKYSFPRRVWTLHMLCFTTRLKYYGVWALTEAACILAGLGYNGIDPITGKASWNRLRHVDPIGVETAQNTRGYLGSWNINTNNWLRNYIYLRVTPRGKKPGFRATLATFITSAFWHGFYPGYYLSFILASFVQTVAKNFRRYFRPFFLDHGDSKPTSLKIFYDIFSYLATQIAFTFVTVPFIFLDLESSYIVWYRVYFFGIIGTALSMAFFASPMKKLLVKRLNQRNGTKKSKSPPSQNTTSEVDPILGVPPLSEDLHKDIVQELNSLVK